MRPALLDRHASRELDRRAVEEYGLAGVVLMENAGRGAADLLCQLDRPDKVIIACGKGNNGGDGFVMARHLDLRSLSVRVVLLAHPEQISGDARINFEVLRRTDVPIDLLADPIDFGRLQASLQDADWIVDGLLGTGAHGAPRRPLDGVIEACNQAASHRLALDLPSGLDCDTGRAAGAVFRADHTCTFAAWKAGFLNPEAARFTGQIHVADIGTPRKLIDTLGRG
ncbi:MAG: NAD(P)H-hydrate epimerase [Pirellulales bacterium]